MTIVRPAQTKDCSAIARIHNEAIAEGGSSFETQERSAAGVKRWLDSPGYPLIVAKRDGAVVGWARVSAYSDRGCYAGVGEASVYVHSAERGRGFGQALVRALTVEAARAGFHKLIAKVIADNDAGRRLLAGEGFREVGILQRHGRVDGEWRDVALVELVLPTYAARPAGRRAQTARAF